MIKPKVGIIVLSITYLMPESLVLTCAKMFLLLFAAVKD